VVLKSGINLLDQLIMVVLTNQNLFMRYQYIMMIEFLKSFKEWAMINFKGNMRIPILASFILLIPISCNNNEKNHIASPSGKQKLVFQWVNSLVPQNKGYVKIYIDDSHQYVDIRPFMDFPSNIYWGDTLKVRGGFLVSTSSKLSMINFKEDYSEN